MNMGELTREEVTARIETVGARIDARAQATDSKIDVLVNEMRALARAIDSKIESLANEMKILAQATDSKIEAIRVEINALRIEAEAPAQATESKIAALAYKVDGKMNKGFADMIKGLVGAAIAMMAIAVTVIVFLFNNVTPRHLPLGVAMPPASAPVPAR